MGELMRDRTLLTFTTQHDREYTIRLDQLDFIEWQRENNGRSGPLKGAIVFPRGWSTGVQLDQYQATLLSRKLQPLMIVEEQ